MNIRGRVARLEKDAPASDREAVREAKEWWTLTWGFWQEVLQPYPEALATVRHNVEGNERCVWNSPAAVNGQLDSVLWVLNLTFWTALRDFPEAHRHALLATMVLRRYLDGECEWEDYQPVYDQLARQYAGASTNELDRLFVESEKVRPEEQEAGA